jgi:hypothetical protein
MGVTNEGFITLSKESRGKVKKAKTKKAKKSLADSFDKKASRRESGYLYTREYNPIEKFFRTATLRRSAGGELNYAGPSKRNVAAASFLRASARGLRSPKYTVDNKGKK